MLQTGLALHVCFEEIDTKESMSLMAGISGIGGIETREVQDVGSPFTSNGKKSCQHIDNDH